MNKTVAGNYHAIRAPPQSWARKLIFHLVEQKVEFPPELLEL